MDPVFTPPAVEEFSLRTGDGNQTHMQGGPFQIVPGLMQLAYAVSKQPWEPGKFWTIHLHHGIIIPSENSYAREGDSFLFRCNDDTSSTGTVRPYVGAFPSISPAIELQYRIGEPGEPIEPWQTMRTISPAAGGSISLEGYLVGSTANPLIQTMQPPGKVSIPNLYIPPTVESPLTRESVTLLGARIELYTAALPATLDSIALQSALPRMQPYASGKRQQAVFETRAHAGDHDIFHLTFYMDLRNMTALQRSMRTQIPAGNL